MATKVLVGLSTMEYIRKANFLPYFLGLDRPTGSFTTTVHGQSPAEARNIIIEQALENNCTHIFFMDDDMAIPPYAITRLLCHDKDIVTGLYLHRDYPHFPVVFDEAFENGLNKYLFMAPDVDGLIPITNCGLGCCLIKIEVFKKMEKPWVRLGEIKKDGWSDDIGFFNRARESGFHLYCDTELRVGHMVSLTIWPDKINGIWNSVYKSDKGNVTFPQVIPQKETV